MPENPTGNDNGGLKKDKESVIPPAPSPPCPLEIIITLAPNGEVKVSGPIEAKVLCLGMIEVAKVLIINYQRPINKILPAKHGILDFARKFRG